LGVKGGGGPKRAEDRKSNKTAGGGEKERVEDQWPEARAER